MRRYVRLPLVLAACGLLAVLALGVAEQQFRLAERGWFNLKTWWQPAEQSMGLDRYRVVIEAQTVEGLDDDISALTYDPDRKTLFTVTNKRSELIELSLDGRILRLTFLGTDTYAPLLGRIARATAVDYNILSGRIDRIKDTPYGQLTVALVDGDLDAAQAAFVAAGVHVEELRR